MLKTTIITAVALTAMGIAGYLFTMSLGKPISSDLSMIAKGKPAVVLAYENFSPTGGAALNRLREVRGDYEMQLDFAVADLGHPQGSAFANRYKLVDGLAVFLDKDGVSRWVSNIPEDEERLRKLLDVELALD